MILTLMNIMCQVSGSMISEKLDQVKLAMEKILMHDLGSENFFSIITFNNTVKVKHQSNLKKIMRDWDRGDQYRCS